MASGRKPTQQSQFQWAAPATHGEMASALLICRLLFRDLYDAVSASGAGNVEARLRAAQSYFEHDKQLGELIDKIGGLDLMEDG